MTQPKGGTSFGSQDDVIFIPITTVQKFLAGVNHVSTLNVQAMSSEAMS